MDNETAWNVRRVVLSVLLLLIVAVPLYPELFGLDEMTPFTQLVVVPAAAAGRWSCCWRLVMLLRWNWRIAAGLVAPAGVHRRRADRARGRCPTRRLHQPVLAC